MKMEIMNLSLAMGALALASIGGLGCTSIDNDEDEPLSASRSEELERGADAYAKDVGLVGAHLPGISDRDFDHAREEFSKDRTIEEGLGPVFNGRSCGGCHKLGAPGGAGDEVEIRFGRFKPDSTFDSLAAEGGSLVQTGSLGTWTAQDGTLCHVPTEVVPTDATVTTHRLPTALFGIGLLDAMPDSFFFELAAAEPDEVRGAVNLVHIALPDIEDPSQEVGGQRVGRFTWKAATVGVTEFAAAAFLNEVGISNQHCVHGASVTTWATDLAPGGIAVAPVACQDGIPGTDYSVGSCDGNRTEIEPHAAEFSRYMKFLAPPPRPASARSEAARRGKHHFVRVGCGGCHTTRAFTTPEHPFNGVPGNYEFHPYSDYLLHDIGELGDHIGQQGETAEKVHLMKTAPLWGIRLRPRLLHDGRATNVANAIRAHGGQAAAAVHAFGALNPRQRDELVTFVLSL